MIAAILLARSLEPQGFAAYSYFQMTVAMLSAYGAMGLGVTASRYFAEFGHEPTGVAAPIGTLLILSLVMGVLAFCLIISLPQTWLHAGLPVPQWLIALGVAVSVMGVVPAGGILGLEKYRDASFISLISCLVMLGMTWIAVRGQSPRVGMWGLIAGISVQAAGQLVVIVFTTGWQAISSSCHWTWKELRKLAGFAGPMFLVSILTGSSTWIVGRLVLAGSNEVEFSAYSIGLQWFALGLMIPGMVSRVVLPRLVRTEGGEARRFVRVGSLMALAPALLFAGAGAVLAPWLIQLYGEQYTSYVYVISAFLAIAALNAPINTVGNAIVAKGGQVIWLILSSSSFACLVIVMSAVPDPGLVWSCVAHFISSLLMIILVGLYAKRKELI